MFLKTKKQITTIEENKRVIICDYCEKSTYIGKSFLSKEWITSEDLIRKEESDVLLIINKGEKEERKCVFSVIKLGEIRHFCCNNCWNKYKDEKIKLFLTKINEKINKKQKKEIKIMKEEIKKLKRKKSFINKLLKNNK